MVNKKSCGCSNKDVKPYFNFCPYCGKRITTKRYPVDGCGPKFGAYAIKTGEFRPPKKGEYYLSGAFPVAYKAPNDLSIAYYIMEVIFP